MIFGLVALVAFIGGALLGGFIMFKLGDRRGRDSLVDEMMAAEMKEMDEVERVWARRAREERRPS